MPARLWQLGSLVHLSRNSPFIAGSLIPHAQLFLLVQARGLLLRRLLSRPAFSVIFPFVERPPAKNAEGATVASSPIFAKAGSMIRSFVMP